MNEAMARLTITNLRRMTVAQADTALCRMHSEDWHALAGPLGLRLPTIGGDKPAILVGALFAKEG